jgi:hypothetical protein
MTWADSAGAAAAVQASPGVSWVTVLVALLGSGVVSALVSAVATSARAASETRRQGYATAIESVVAWAEYPYRIRRRTSDDEVILTDLANRGHELQEQRAKCLAWVAGENSVAYEVFLVNVRHLDAIVGPLAGEAWKSPPVTHPSGMLLSGWGAGRQAQETVERLTCLISFRTGWRRWFVSLWPPMLRWRLRRYRPPEDTSHATPIGQSDPPRMS